MPLAIAALIAVAVVVGKCTGASIQWPAMLLAAAIGLISGEAGLLPLLLHQGDDPAGRFQSAWIGTVLHLGLAVMLSALVLLMLKPGTVFVYWLLGMYWLTLICLCTVMVRVFRSPAMGKSSAAVR